MRSAHENETQVRSRVSNRYGSGRGAAPDDGSRNNRLEPEGISELVVDKLPFTRSRLEPRRSAGVSRRVQSVEWRYMAQIRGRLLREPFLVGSGRSREPSRDATFVKGSVVTCLTLWLRSSRMQWLSEHWVVHFAH